MIASEVLVARGVSKNYGGVLALKDVTFTAYRGKVNVLVGETVYPLEILDERKLRLRRAAGKFTSEGPQRIDAPMPGKVTRVLVKVGDEVQEGQGLLVVEAMKMENELKAPQAGTVRELTVAEGQNVDSGAQLLVRVQARAIFPNCPRYIVTPGVAEPSKYAPRPDYQPPEPAWKGFDDFKDHIHPRQPTFKG